MRQWIQRQTLLASSFGLALAASSVFFPATAAAQQPAGELTFWQTVHRDFHRNNAWPEPFRSADRGITREYFCIQANNGWKMQNTVGTFLFNTETQELNRAGELQVKWIVTQAPIHRRAVFVLVGDTPEDTQKRVLSVQNYISRIVPAGQLPPVMITYTQAEGASGAYFDAINNAMMQSIPAPRLPGGASGSQSGGGSGGN